jgi:hypothetical protein
MPHLLTNTFSVLQVKSHCKLCNNQSDLTDTASKYPTFSMSQLDIAKSLSLAAQCTHNHVLKMVICPQGSGKTRILVAILHLLYQLDFRVLVCVPQKMGTFELWKTLEASGYPINEIIDLDSLKGIRIPKKFHQTCLHTKSHEFRTCLVMARQWIEEMKMLLQLMVYCPSSCNHVPKDGRCSHTGLPLFTKKLYRKAFLPLAIDMRKCLIELIDKYSKMYLPDSNKTNIGIVLNLLEASENLLFNETPSEEHIQRAFDYLPPLSIAEKMTQATSGSFGHALAKQMNDARLEFADLLQNFGKSTVDTNKVAPFVRGQDDEGASQVDGSFTGRGEARGGAMASALDLSTNKMEPFSSSDAVGDTSGSGGGSYPRRCDDRVTPPFDPQLSNATQVTSESQRHPFLFQVDTINRS